MQKINHVEQKDKTYAEDFKAKLPHAPVDDRGCPTGCRRLFYGGRTTMCEDCTRTISCYTCWNTLMGDET